MSSVRPSEKADAPALRQVLDATGLFPAEMLEPMMAPALDGQAQALWLTHAGEGGIDGFVYAAPEALTDGTWSMLALAVLPESQRTGAGRRLVRAVENALREGKVRVLIADTSGSDDFAAARAFYRSNGYDEEARIRDYWAGGRRQGRLSQGPLRMAALTLILGGARSGKTARALSLCPAPHCYIATAEARDAEMADRIAAHRAERGPSWDVAEAPLDLAATIAERAAPGTHLLVDCLTLWLSNLLHADRDREAETANLLAAIDAVPGSVVAVSNEIGLGLVPMEPLSRAFRDAQGRLNQQVAAAATRVEFVAAGLPLVLKG